MGFYPRRGIGDATFKLKSALNKCKEHGLETWVLFIDFVKAFDRAPREILWEILEKIRASP
eukprot:10408803-Ditylum_brightwellii.AAC.2